MQAIRTLEAARAALFDKRQGRPMFVARTVAFCMVVTLSILILATVLGLAEPADIPTGPVPETIFDVLLGAPLVENILFILVCEFLLAFKLRRITVVLTIGSLSAIVHGLLVDWRAVTGFITFSVMTYSYLIWSERSFTDRYLLTVSQHVLFNLPAALVIASTAVP